jgi:predicted acetyltransferase
MTASPFVQPDRSADSAREETPPVPEVRPLTPDDIPAYSAIAGYAFNGTPKRIRVYLEPPFAGRMLGVFSEGKLAAALMEFPFEVWLLGRLVEAVGVATIASAPETRRSGLVRELMTGHLRRLRDEGVGLSLLYPFSFAFYERLGWSLAAQRVKLRVPPAEFAAYGRRVGRMRQLIYAEKGLFQPLGGETEESAIATLDRVYEREAIRFNLAARRTEEYWRNRVLQVDEGRRFAFVWEDDAGEVRGHVISRVAEEKDMAPLVVREIISTTPDGWRGLFFFLSCHESQHKHVRLVLPAGSPLLDLFGNPRLKESKVSPGVMARIVDVKGLLEARGGPGAAGSGGVDGRSAVDAGQGTASVPLGGSCLVRVHDRLAPWNDGTFAVRCDGLAVTVREVKAGDSMAGAAAAPDLDIDIGILSRVAVGARSLGDILEFGLATGRPGPGLDFALSFFPARPIWHPEYY